MEINKYIVWYAYKAMETEGNVHLQEPKRILARSKSEALHKYNCFNAFENKKEPYFKTLSEHISSDFPDGGWGNFVAKLDPSEYCPVHFWDNKYETDGYNL